MPIDYRIPMSVRAPTLGDLIPAYMQGENFRQKQQDAAQLARQREQEMALRQGQDARAQAGEQRAQEQEKREAFTFQQSTDMRDIELKDRSAKYQRELMGAAGARLLSIPDPISRKEWFEDFVEANDLNPGIVPPNMTDDFITGMIKAAAGPEASLQQQRQIKSPGAPDLMDPRKAEFEAWQPEALKYIESQNGKVDENVKNYLRQNAPAGQNGFTMFESFLKGLQEKKIPPAKPTPLERGAGRMMGTIATRHSAENSAYDQRMNAYNGIQANKIAEQKNPAGVNDAALLEKLVILETGSNSPTDTQIHMYARAAGIPERIANTIRRGMKGNFLTSEQRQAMYDLADEQVEIQTMAYEESVRNRIASLKGSAFEEGTKVALPLSGTYTLYRKSHPSAEDLSNDPVFSGGKAAPAKSSPAHRTPVKLDKNPWE